MLQKWLKQTWILLAKSFSNGGLKSIIALLVRWQINFSCVSTGGPIQL